MLLMYLIFLTTLRLNFLMAGAIKKLLLHTLEENIDSDTRRKTTLHGPHKSDIKFFINGIDAKQVLSRGEQKFFLFCGHAHKTKC